MSLISTFISTQLIKAIENEFLNHSPEIQAAIINEIQHFISQVSDWATKKLSSTSTPSGEQLK